MQDREKMRAASQSFKLLFKKSLQQGTLPETVAAALGLADDIPTTAFVSKMRWWTSVPIMRHWVGARRHRELMAEGQDVTLKPFESTIDVLRDDILFDALGGYRSAIQKMAREVQLLPYRRILEVIKDGFAGGTYTCWDGLPLFSDTHNFGDNKSILDLDADALDVAMKTMAQFSDPDTGDSLMIRPTHLWHHVDLEPTVRKLIGRSELAGGGTNEQFGLLKPLPLDLGSGKEEWWGVVSLMDNEPMKPVLYLRHPRNPGIVAKDAETDDDNFEKRVVVYGTEAWGAEACGFPMFIWGSDGTE